MPAFESVKTVPVRLADLSPAAQEIMDYFRAQGYEVTGKPSGNNGVLISLRKGDTFKAVLGMKTSLNIEIDPAIDGTLIRAKVGIWGEQAIPTMITLFIAWPILLTQIWGMAQQSNLDDEALFRAEQALLRQAGAQGVVTPPPSALAASAPYTQQQYTQPQQAYPQQTQAQQPQQQQQQPQQQYGQYQQQYAQPQQAAYAPQPPAAETAPAAAPVSYTYSQPAPEQPSQQAAYAAAPTTGPATPPEALAAAGAATVPTAEAPSTAGETATSGTSTIFCMNCGTSLPSDARFCFKCGKPITTTA